MTASDSVQHIFDQYFPIVFPLFFVGMWCLVCAIISMVGGWFTLSQRFRATAPSNGETYGMRSGQMRWFTNYNGVLALGAGRDGLYMATFFPFRFMHPPLLIPWSEIQVRRWKGLIFEYVTFTLGRESAIPLRIRAGLADDLRSSAGGSWPVEES